MDPFDSRGIDHVIAKGRRRLLTGVGAAVLAAAVDGCSVAGLRAGVPAPPAPPLNLVPLRASTDRITQITVCTRPFRAQGPRLDVEQIGDRKSTRLNSSHI